MVLRRRRLTERYHGPTVRRSFIERTQAAGTGEKLEWSPESHVVSNLCMLSPDSRNGRTYTPQAMEDLRKLYEGARAYQDHPDDPTAPRSTKERLGRWHNVRIEGDKLRGDLHYDPNHPYSRSLIWAAQECPEHCGVSHNVEAEGYEDPSDGHFTVTKVNEVRSVDIVDDPATNKSLLESHSRKRRPRRTHKKVKEGAMDPELDDGMGGEDGMSPEHHLGAYVSACMDDPTMSKQEKLKNITTVIKNLLKDGDDGEEEDDLEEDEDFVKHDPEAKRGKPGRQEKEKDDQYHGEIGVGEEKEDDEEEEGPMMARESLQRLARHKDKNVRNLAERALRALPKPKTRRVATESLGRHQDPAVRAMAKRLDVLEAEKIAVSSVQKAIQECKAAGLPKRVMTRLFIEDLAECTDKRRRKQMIQERAHLASINLPRSYGPNGIGGGPPRVSDADFASMVNGDG